MKRTTYRDSLERFLRRAALLFVLLFAAVLASLPFFAQQRDSTALDPSAWKRRPKVAYVLSGGGAKGAVHIGALKVLEEEGGEELEVRNEEV